MKKILSVFLIISFVFVLSACNNSETTTEDNAKVLEDAKTALTLPDTTAVAADLTLPETAGDASVIWLSSNTTVLTSDGHVVLPTNSTGDTTVTLTAILTYEGLMTTKTFTVTVKSADITDAEKVANALDMIDIPTSIEADIVLPTEYEGATLEWSSSNPDYIDAQGNIVRPHYDYSDESAVLTAYVSAGKELRMFKQTVTIPKMPYAQHGAVEQQFTVKITNKDGHELYIPYNFLNPESINIWASNTPAVYTRDTGLTTMPTLDNDWGIAVVIDGGKITKIYDGIAKRIQSLDTDGVTVISSSLEENTKYSMHNIEIPENGAVILFYNSGIGNDKNSRDFGTTYLYEVGAEATVENTGAVVKLTGGVFWRGFSELYIPIDADHFNPDPTTVDWTSLTNFDDNGTPDDTTDDVVTSAAPAIYTPAYGTSVDVNHGYGIIAVVRPEADLTQDVGTADDPNVIELENQWEIFAVYDGIGAGYKEKGLPTTTLDQDTYGANVQIPEDGYVIVFPNNGVEYSADALNRRVAADYWYHVENWVWDYELVSTDDVPATYPVTGVEK